MFCFGFGHIFYVYNHHICVYVYVYVFSCPAESVTSSILTHYSSQHFVNKNTVRYPPVDFNQSETSHRLSVMQIISSKIRVCTLLLVNHLPARFYYFFFQERGSGQGARRVTMVGTLILCGLVCPCVGLWVRPKVFYVCVHGGFVSPCIIAHHLIV